MIAIFDAHAGDGSHADNCTDQQALVDLVRDPRARPLVFGGDTFELLQFDKSDIPLYSEVLVAKLASRGNGIHILTGNHDREMGRESLTWGRTLFLHGHQFDPLWDEQPWWSYVGGAILKWVEGWFPPANRYLEKLRLRLIAGGRYGEKEKYARRAAFYASTMGFDRIVFGHLHERFSLSWAGLDIICGGAYCGGRSDILELEYL